MMQLNETTYKIHQGLMRVSYTDETTPSEVADFIRAILGVTRVTAISTEKDLNRSVFKVKILTGKISRDAFNKVKASTIKMIPGITKVELAPRTYKIVG